MTTSTGGARPMVHPEDDVLAVIDDPGRAEATVQALGAAGFTGEDIHTFRGRQEIGDLGRAWWKHSGVPSFLAPLLAAVLSDESGVEEIYEAEGLAGHTVLAVHCRSRADVARAIAVLHGGGAHDAWYFGRWTLTPITPEGHWAP